MNIYFHQWATTRLFNKMQPIIGNRWKCGGIVLLFWRAFSTTAWHQLRLRTSLYSDIHLLVTFATASALSMLDFTLTLSTSCTKGRHMTWFPIHIYSTLYLLLCCYHHRHVYCIYVCVVAPLYSQTNQACSIPTWGSWNGNGLSYTRLNPVYSI